MERQFSAIPYLIFVYVFQLMSIFVMNLIYTNIEDISYEEKIISWFLAGLFYILYFNGIIKFVRSFYEIMKNSKIDDSDLVSIDAWIAFGLGVLFLAYGSAYAFWTTKKLKIYLGYSSLVVALLLWLQFYLMRKFYVVAAEN